VNGVDVRAAVAAAAASALGACALTPVFSSAGWALPVLAAVLVVLAGGLLLRLGGTALWSRLTSGRPVPDRLATAGVALVPVGQLFLVLCLLTARYAPGHALGGVLPTRASLAELGSVLAAGRAEIQEQATPALPLTGLVALTVVFVAMVAVVIDLVAVAGRQAALAGLGLLVLYSVPVATITGGIGPVAIAAPAAGLALLLWIDQHRRLATSGRQPPPRLSTGTLAALRIGSASVVAGLVLGSLVPTLTEGSLATGLGGGSGSATGTSLDPVAAMRGQLTLPEPIDLLRVQTSVAEPGALRAVSLDEYDDRNGWTMSNLDGETSIAEDDRLAPPPAGEAVRPVAATIEVLEHDDRFLPVPFSPLSVHMDDGRDRGWRFDPASGTVYGREVTSAGRSYSVTAEEPRPTPELLAQTEALPPGDPVQRRYTALPFLDGRVTATVAEVLGDAEGPYERVRRIHAYLTDRGNGFRYSLSTEAGTSGDDLVDFLRLKRGYCEQYAGAMAVMVRAAGVPARVVLGYTPGTAEDDGSRLITSDDAHAWVEVYFQGLGWVPFDPTPISRGRAVDMPWAPRADAPSGTDGELGGAAPSAPAQPVPTDRADRAVDPVLPAGSSGNGGGPGGTLLAGAGAALLIVLLLATPAAVRVRQRRHRLAAGSAGALWDELAATAQDLDIRLEPTWTPRRTAAELGTRLEVGGRRTGSADAVRRLALAEEAASYGPASGHRAHPDLEGALRVARRGLLAAATGRARLRARVWPASLMTGAAGRTAAAIRRRLPDRTPLRRRPRSV
jgi:transglutaminase-like putative cysteine protease